MALYKRAFRKGHGKKRDPRLLETTEPITALKGGITLSLPPQIASTLTLANSWISSSRI